MTKGPRPRPLAERLWAKVDRTAGPDACWPWTGSLTKGGYGKIRAGSITEPILSAHVAAYVVTFGPVPDGREVDHVKARGCVRRDCCNPSHLEAVTHRENNARADTISTVNARKTHCPANHAYDLANTYICRNGARSCRRCRANQDRKRRRLAV